VYTASLVSEFTGALTFENLFLCVSGGALSVLPGQGPVWADCGILNSFFFLPRPGICIYRLLILLVTYIKVECSCMYQSNVYSYVYTGHL